MKLVAEQVKILRDRREELLRLKDEYYERTKNKEKDTIDRMGVLYDNDPIYNNTMNELNRINEALEEATFVPDRDYSQIGIGTKFKVHYGDDLEDSEELMLVESNIGTTPLDFVSLDSDMGKAIMGTKEGDKVTYIVEATGIEISLTVDEIDRVRSHYEHFIREKTYDRRVRKAAKEEIKKAIEEGTYLDSISITTHQYDMLVQEKAKLGNRPRPELASKKAFLTKCLHLPVADAPNDDTIGVGSNVTLLLDDEGEKKTISFEYIHHAVSTELESDYVEKISTLGAAIYGKRAGDQFKVARNQLSYIKGIVVSVDNDSNKELKKVR